VKKCINRKKAAKPVRISVMREMILTLIPELPKSSLVRIRGRKLRGFTICLRKHTELS